LFVTAVLDEEFVEGTFALAKEVPDAMPNGLDAGDNKICGIAFRMMRLC
jgi:hypothetical protein